MKNKKGQIWSLDLMVASIIFFIGIVILFLYAINFSSQTKNQLDELFYGGNLASSLLLSDGEYGLLTDNKINQTKLEYFDSLSSSDKKLALGIRQNFYFTFGDLEINGNPTDNVGIVNSSTTEDSVLITRLSIYRNTPIKFQLYVWD